MRAEHQEDHARLIRAILDEVADTPLVLKGGAALQLAYGLDRISYDLNFDAPQLSNLEHRIKFAAPEDFRIREISALKYSSHIYRITYDTEASLARRMLRIEVSDKTPISEADTRVIDGIKVASLARLIDHKLAAAFDGADTRAAACDLYDLDFLARTYPEQFTGTLAQRLQAFAADPDQLIERYSEAFEDERLSEDDDIYVETMAHSLHDSAVAIAALQDARQAHEARAPLTPAMAMLEAKKASNEANNWLSAELAKIVQLTASARQAMAQAEDHTLPEIERRRALGRAGDNEARISAEWVKLIDDSGPAAAARLAARLAPCGDFAQNYQAVFQNRLKEVPETVLTLPYDLSLLKQRLAASAPDRGGTPVPQRGLTPS